MPETFEGQFNTLEGQEEFRKKTSEERKEIISVAQEEAALARETEIILTSDQQTAKERMIQYLADGRVDDAIKVKDCFFIPEEIVQQAAKEGMIQCLANGRVNDAIKIKDRFSLSDEILVSPEVQQAAKEGMIQCLVICWVDGAIKIKDRFSIPEEIVQQAAKEGMIRCLVNDLVYGAIGIKDHFSLSDEILVSPEVQQAAKEGMIQCLANGSLNTAINIKDQFFLPEEFIQSPEVQQAAKERMIQCLVHGWVDDALKIKDRFSLPEEIVQQAAKEGMIRFLADGRVDDALKIKDHFSLSDEILASPEVQQAAKEGMIQCLAKGWVDNAIEIKDRFSIPEEIVQQAAKEGMIQCLANGGVDDALKIKDRFSIPEEIVQQAAKEGMIQCLAKGWVDDALKIKDRFFIPEEIVQQTAKEGIIKRLVNGRVDHALKIKNAFDMRITPKEIIDQLPNILDLLRKLDEISPHIASQAGKSLETLFALFPFKDNPKQLLDAIKKNPFLADAVENNPRYGSKLLLKYQEFDELSKENIRFLFDAKKEILETHPDIDLESLEFRQLMQEKLKTYVENPAIIQAIEKNGINVDQWLNYAEASYFNLESGENHLPFSETISTPINRIKETLDSYAHTLKDVLKEYRTELSEFRTPLEDPKETEAKIAQMQTELEKAKVEGNEKKAQGIERGIEGLKKKIENIKTVALWDKLLGDISAFQQLKNDVFSAQEKLMQAENDLQEKLSGKLPSGKMIQELKEKISKVKEELRSKFGTLERRIEDFQNNVSGLISPCLGKERSDALLQEIKTNLAEQFEHYNTDRSTLANLFSERGDKQKEKIENQPMSIFIWARNPDIDLYQGNYSPCCICIDSAHMGAESTIADYNTDLGVQIVNIWDETKDEPITAAWCWLGRDKEGNTALVVDNIESNTLYSANYSEQLTKELFEYLQNYAKSIGAKKVVLGKANNDLPTSGELAKMNNDSGMYEKIGGYNREGGYFLEAEEKSVKIIWDGKEQIKKIKETIKEKKIKRVEFKDLGTKNLTEKDFVEIKQLEQKIYENTDLISGETMIEDIKRGNGFEYSIIITGKRTEKEKEEAIGYIIAVEDETDEGDPCVYLEDIAITPEAQGQGKGWELMKAFVERLKKKAARDGKPVLLDMHLRSNSQRFMERHQADLEALGVHPLEEALVSDYYDQGEDALYKLYEVRAE